jgi:ABC-type multidrug transport system fused ATPase/permease subunit
VTRGALHGWKNLAPYGGRLLLLTGLSAAEVALRVALPWPMKAVVDYAIGDIQPPAWMIVVGGMRRDSWLVIAVVTGILLQMLHQAVLMVHTRVHTETGHRLTRDLRQRLFVHLQSLSLRHHSRMPVGTAVYHLQADASFLDLLLVRGVLPLVFSAATLVVMFAILLRIDVTLAVVSMAIVPLLYLWIRWYAPRLRPTADHTHVVESRLSARLQESFAAIRLVKSFAREPYEGQRFASAATDAMLARVALTGREAWFSLVVGNLIMLGTAAVVWYGGMRVLSGELTIGTLLMALAYLGFVYGPLSGIAHSTGTIQHALAGARRVRDVFALATEVDDGHAVTPHFKGDIEFKHVSFAYDGTSVLHEITVSVRSGEMVALVGPSGSGKTTLVSLIPRFYDPSSGHILIDGRDSSTYRLRTLREQIAIVQQEPIVLAGSVRDNLRYGRLDASDQAIEEAARAAHAHEFIVRLANGYDTDLVEAGNSLSGGQKQRLGIARAFLKNAPILILDEPTSALDAVSEEHVLGAIEQLRQGRTTFVIAHRLSTVLAADRVLLLDRGRLVAEGTHGELLRGSDLYRRLASQLNVPDKT